MKMSKRLVVAMTLLPVMLVCGIATSHAQSGQEIVDAIRDQSREQIARERQIQRDAEWVDYQRVQQQQAEYQRQQLELMQQQADYRRQQQEQQRQEMEQRRQEMALQQPVRMQESPQFNVPNGPDMAKDQFDSASTSRVVMPDFAAEAQKAAASYTRTVSGSPSNAQGRADDTTGPLALAKFMIDQQAIQTSKAQMEARLAEESLAKVLAQSQGQGQVLGVSQEPGKSSVGAAPIREPVGSVSTSRRAAFLLMVSMLLVVVLLIFYMNKNNNSKDNG